MGRLFDKPFRPKGSPRRAPGGSRASRSVQTARRAPSVFFKNIRGAGTSNRAGLNGQLEYILNEDKVSFVFDSQCRFDRAGTLERPEMLALTREWEKTWRYPTKLGNTTHMVMSFPKGTDPLTVMEITRSVCEEKFQGEHGVFDYLASVHTDTDHPHTHVIVNRFRKDGGLFTLRKDGPHSFEAFRECIARHAKVHGVELSDATRFERGIVDRPPSHEEVQKARREGAPLPSDRPRVGADLDYALERVNDAALIHAATSMLAANFGLEKIEAIVVKAALTLEEGQSIEGEYLVSTDLTSEAERFDSAVETLNATMKAARARIEDAPAQVRPGVERNYTDILKELRDVAPASLQSERLAQEPSDLTPYGDTFIVNKDVLRHPDFQRVLENRLSSTGIPLEEMRERLVTGANNDELASMWIRRDLAYVAGAQGLDLDTNDGLRTARQNLADTYGELRLDLLQYRAASMTSRFEELARSVHREDDGSYPGYTALRSDAEVAAAAEQLSQIIDEDKPQPEAIKDYLDDTTPDLSDEQRTRLIASLSGVIMAADLKAEQDALRNELRAAKVSPTLIEASLAVHRPADGSYRATIPNEFALGVGRELRDEVGVEQPTVEDFDAHIKKEAPGLRAETRENLAQRLFEVTNIRTETVAQDTRSPFSADDTRNVVTRLENRLLQGARLVDPGARADVARVVRDNLDREDLERLERGDAHALSKLTTDPTTQKAMGFEYLRGEVASGRNDLADTMRSFNSEVQKSVADNAQQIQKPKQGLN